MGLKSTGSEKKISSYINGRYFADNIFKSIYLKGSCIYIEISLQFITKYQFNNKSILVQIIVWRRTGDKKIVWIINVVPYRRIYMSHSATMTYICES